MLEIDFEINKKSLLEFSGMNRIDESEFENHLNFGKVTFADSSLQLEMDEVNLIGFFDGFLGGLRALFGDNDISKFAGVGFWNSYGTHGFKMSMTESTLALTYQQDEGIVFETSLGLIESYLLKIILIILDELSSLRPEYKTNEVFLSYRNSILDDFKKIG